MLRPLSSVRRRVERLAKEAAPPVCHGDHTRLMVSHLWGDEPPPAWPERERGDCCACGAELEYLHVVHHYATGPEESANPSMEPANAP